MGKPGTALELIFLSGGILADTRKTWMTVKNTNDVSSTIRFADIIWFVHTYKKTICADEARLSTIITDAFQLVCSNLA